MHNAPLSRRRLQDKSLTTGPLLWLWLSMSRPMLGGFLAMAIFHLTDTFFVARLGTEPLAALALTVPVTTLFLCLSLGLGAATNALVARAYGARQMHEVSHLIIQSLLFAFVLVSILGFIGWMIIDPVVAFLGASQHLVSLIKSYMNVWFAGACLLVLPVVANHALRAVGEVKLPARTMMLAAGLNLVLDPFFIYGFGMIPAMGLQGAAVASVLARAGAFMWVLMVLGSRYKIFLWRRSHLQNFPSTIMQQLSLSLPAMMHQMAAPMVAFLVTKALAEQSYAMVAAFGIVARLEIFFLIPLRAMNSGLAPMVGQNYGANKGERLDRLLVLSRLVVIFVYGFIALMVIIGSRRLVSMFSNNQQVIEAACSYFLAVAPTYGCVGIFQFHMTTLQAVGQAQRSLILSLICYFGLQVPLIYFGIRWKGTGVFLALAFSHVLMMIAAVVIKRHPQTIGINLRV